VKGRREEEEEREERGGGGGTCGCENQPTLS